MCGTGLDLLGQRVDIAEAALKRATREYGADARCPIGPVGNLNACLDGIAADQADAGAVLKIDNRPIVCALIYVRQY